ncbi:Alpha/Beta hydrolase protein [Cokeromyces recurvatus]|uniref:Alpha/Beta hydrolase protein n=1 Tax=Cokeromyces recurvatus TaxID=90255 RepID=UPI00221F1E78|nr:Alpha/Beta hydrolase protein [Cokeromyces recurvatus]KAI7907607.1 Alpha/Beta hydrolase protein [Cokeromyces recurvatus]
MQTINVQKANFTQRNRATPPDPKKVKLKFDYSSSQDGVDFNLLILLHGLGDTKKPFLNLGKKLQLPQTAILSVQAPEEIPYMDGCYQWFPSFNMLTVLTSRNPERWKGLLRTRALMNELIDHLIRSCGFNPSNIFLFGFSQGATIALDVAMFGKVPNLGGVVSISGYLLEEQSNEQSKYAGYILITQGDKDNTIGSKSEAEKRFKMIKNKCSPSAEVSQVFIENKDHTMPTSEKEWRIIHTFFGKNMPRRNIELENMSDVYLVNP